MRSRSLVESDELGRETTLQENLLEAFRSELHSQQEQFLQISEVLKQETEAINSKLLEIESNLTHSLQSINERIESIENAHDENRQRETKEPDVPVFSSGIQFTSEDEFILDLTPHSTHFRYLPKIVDSEKGTKHEFSFPESTNILNRLPYPKSARDMSGQVIVQEDWRSLS